MKKSTTSIIFEPRGIDVCKLLITAIYYFFCLQELSGDVKIIAKVLSLRFEAGSFYARISIRQFFSRFVFEAGLYIVFEVALELHYIIIQARFVLFQTLANLVSVEGPASIRRKRR